MVPNTYFLEPKWYVPNVTGPGTERNLPHHIGGSYLGAMKMLDVKMTDVKLTDEMTGHENAGHENRT